MGPKWTENALVVRSLCGCETRPETGKCEGGTSPQVLGVPHPRKTRTSQTPNQQTSCSLGTRFGAICLVLGSPGSSVLVQGAPGIIAVVLPCREIWLAKSAHTSPGMQTVRVSKSLSTLEVTQRQNLSQAPTDSTRFWWHLYGS